MKSFKLLITTAMITMLSLAAGAETLSYTINSLLCHTCVTGMTYNAPDRDPVNTLSVFMSIIRL